MIRYSFLFLGLLLIACSQTSKNFEEINSRYFVLKSEINGAQTPIHTSKSTDINYLEWMTYIDDIDQFIISYPPDYPRTKPIFMNAMSIERMPPNSICSAAITGASETKVLSSTNSKTEWGRMDAWDGYGQEGFEWPIDWENIVCKKEGIPAPEEVYTLCSEKNGRTVIICINQMKDDPQLAEEIFKTFRWLE